MLIFLEACFSLCAVIFFPLQLYFPFFRSNLYELAMKLYGISLALVRLDDAMMIMMIMMIMMMMMMMIMMMVVIMMMMMMIMMIMMIMMMMMMMIMMMMIMMMMIAMITITVNLFVKASFMEL